MSSLGRSVTCPEIAVRPQKKSSRLGLLGQEPVAEEERPKATTERGSDPAISPRTGVMHSSELHTTFDAKLKLAPILARRLGAEAANGTASSGSFSSRSSSTPKSPSPSSSPQLRISNPAAIHASEYTKLPSLLRTLEGKRVETSLIGSANLPQLQQREPGSPTNPARTPAAHSFAAAKLQVDRDLGSFTHDAEQLMNRPSHSPQHQEQISKLLDIAEECLESTVEDFRLTVTDIVDGLEEERSACQSRTIKALYTRLLFILARCSRLLITEQLQLFATEPRNRRTGNIQKSMYAATSKTADDTDDDPLFRCHTMPVKAMYDIVQKLHSGELHALGPRRSFDSDGADYMELVPTLSPLRQSPTHPTQSVPAGVSPAQLEHQFNLVSAPLQVPGSPLSDPEAEVSPTASVKKKKGIMKKISNGFMQTIDNLKRKMSSSKDKKSKTSSSQLSPRSSLSATSVPAKQPDSRSTSFQPSPRLHSTSKEIPQESHSSPLTPLRPFASTVHVRDDDPVAMLMVASVSVGGPTSPVTPRVRFSERERSSAPVASEDVKRQRLLIDIRQTGRSQSLSDSGVGEKVPSPEELIVVCSICEDKWQSSKLEEHSEICACIRKIGLGLSADAQLTKLANYMEEQVDQRLIEQSIRPDIVKLVRCARHAAALQPDGSKVPKTRCSSISAEIEKYSDLAQNRQRKVSATVATYARRMAQLVNEKLTLLSEAAGRLSETGSGSGTSTPRSAPGMSIEEFEIIKPISRGAFGRVYLARKHATGDLFAIKVMKKRDLIRKNMVESVTNERNILAMANNPFVVRFFYSFTSKENLYIVMEYINGGDCYSLLRKMGALDEEVARQYVAETVLALEYCHAQGIIHRDMKPDNMLISSNGHVKLTDFGLSCIGVIDRTDNLNVMAAPPKPVANDDDASEMSSSDMAEYPSMDMDSNGVNSFAGQSNSFGPPSLGHQSSFGHGPSFGHAPSFGAAHSYDTAAGAGASHGERRTSYPGAMGLEVHSGPVPGVTVPASNSGRLLIPESEKRRAVGTPDYLAPELLLGTGHGPTVDWWSLGTILYEMVTGVPPFNADSPQEIFDNILDRRLTWPLEDEMSPECRDLIDKLLTLNPQKRLGARGAGEIKLHPFFNGIDWTSLARAKAAFIPTVEHELDTSYFEAKPISRKSMAQDIEPGKNSSNRSPISRVKESEVGKRTSSTGSRISQTGQSQTSDKTPSGPFDSMVEGADQNDESDEDIPSVSQSPSEHSSDDTAGEMSPGVKNAFDNFSFTNLDSLSAKNREKILKLREEYAQKISTQAPDGGATEITPQ